MATIYGQNIGSPFAIVDTDGRLWVNALISGTIVIGSVSAHVDDVTIKSGTVAITSGNIYVSSGNITIDNPATCGSWTGVVNGSSYVLNPETIGSYTGLPNGSSYVTNYPDFYLGSHVWTNGSIYSTGSININTTLKEIGSYTGMNNGSAYITNWNEIGSTVVVGSVFNPQMIGSFTNMSLGSSYISNFSDIGSTRIVVGSVNVTNFSDIGSFRIVSGNVLVSGTISTNIIGSSYVGFIGDGGSVFNYKQVNGKPRVSSMPYLYDIAEGNVPNHTVWSKTGYNPNIGTTEEDLWSSSSKSNWILIPGSIAIYSSNIADALGSIGAQKVYINYLDDEYVAKREDISLAGSTPVWTTGSDIYRINNFRILQAGASGVCIGSLVCGSPTAYSFVSPGYTRARNSQYTVPSGNTLYITSVAYSTVGAANKYVRFINRATYDNGIGSYTGPAGSPGAIFFPYTEMVMGNNQFNKTLEIPTKLPSKTDIVVSAIAEQAGAIGEVQLRGWLE